MLGGHAKKTRGYQSPPTTTLTPREASHALATNSSSVAQGFSPEGRNRQERKQSSASLPERTDLFGMEQEVLKGTVKNKGDLGGEQLRGGW